MGRGPGREDRRGRCRSPRFQPEEVVPPKGGRRPPCGAGGRGARRAAAPRGHGGARGQTREQCAAGAVAQRTRAGAATTPHRTPAFRGQSGFLLLRLEPRHREPPVLAARGRRPLGQCPDPRPHVRALDPASPRRRPPARCPPGNTSLVKDERRTHKDRPATGRTEQRAARSGGRPPVPRPRRCRARVPAAHHDASGSSPAASRVLAALPPGP